MTTQQTGIRDYKDLIVWQKSIDLVTQVYAVTANFPNREQYGLTSQMQRAAVSISSNIAEGQSRASAAEFRQFLSISLGSAGELETQLIIAARLKFMTEEESLRLCRSVIEIRRMLRGLISSTYK
jgi:four helix bundle protein